MLFENSTSEQAKKMQHETQSRQFCGLHTINNLLQLPLQNKVTAKEMDAIADEMYVQEKQIYGDAVKKLPNNHKSKYFLMYNNFYNIVTTLYRGSFGNYSFEVINETLLRRKYQMLPVTNIVELDDTNCIGLIVNIQYFVYVAKEQAHHIDSWYDGTFVLT